MQVKSIAEYSKLPFVIKIFIFYIFEWLFYTGDTSFVDHLCFFCLVFVMPLCASVYLCLVVTCWERADHLAIVCGVYNCEFVTFPLVSWIRCGT